ncbi:MAG: hypothetical protein ABSB57_04495, partial [Dehalococcoidia bacterium]
MHLFSPYVHPAAEIVDHPEMPVERAVILEHQLPAARAELPPTFDRRGFRHAPGLAPLAIVKRSVQFVNGSRRAFAISPAR